jgi:hypothetical protein
MGTLPAFPEKYGDAPRISLICGPGIPWGIVPAARAVGKIENTGTLILQRSLGSSKPVMLVDIFFQTQWLEGESTWMSGRFRAWAGNWSRF